MYEEEFESKPSVYQKYLSESYVYIVSTTSLYSNGFETDVVLLTRDLKLAESTLERLVLTNFDKQVWSHLNRALF